MPGLTHSNELIARDEVCFFTNKTFRDISFFDSLGHAQKFYLSTVPIHRQQAAVGNRNRYHHERRRHRKSKFFTGLKQREYFTLIQFRNF